MARVKYGTSFCVTSLGTDPVALADVQRQPINTIVLTCIHNLRLLNSTVTGKTPRLEYSTRPPQQVIPNLIYASAASHFQSKA